MKNFVKASVVCLATALCFSATTTSSSFAKSDMLHAEMSEPDPNLINDVKSLQDEWAIIKYQVTDNETKLDRIHELETKAHAISNKYPKMAEPKIWEAIILSTDAGIVKGITSLGKLRKARNLLEKSIRLNASALDGSAYTSLGTLYYQVPGWPIGFGDDNKAEENLKHALELNPDGIDPNFFYGDFLLKTDHPKEAEYYLQHALEAPNRLGRELADAGRRQEIKAAIAKIHKE